QLIEELYKSEIKSRELNEKTKTLLERAENYFRNYYERIKKVINNFYSSLYNNIVEKIAEMYGDRKLTSYLKNIPIYIVDKINSPYPNTIVLGTYVSAKDHLGRTIYNAIIIPKWLLHKPYLFIKTLSHELTHAVQDFYGKLRGYKQPKTFEEYVNDPLEKEANEVSSKILSRIYNKLTSLLDYLKNFTHNIYYGKSRMYFL
ncbi:MAG: hypothetical protein QXP34_03800, partial [Candidatus Aenigmatarchaeota archaeon]